MTTRIHMQDQVKNRIELLTDNDNKALWDDIIQTIANLLIVFVFLVFGLSW